MAARPRNTLDRLRATCLALPEVTERLSHGAPTFFVRDKRSFVSVMMDGHHQFDFPHLVCAAAVGLQSALVASWPDCYFVPPYVGVRGWIGVRLDRDVDPVELDALLVDAYRVVAPRALVARLDAGESP